VSETSKDVKTYFTKAYGTGVSEYWGKIVLLCLRRAQCGDLLADVTRDYETAKNHYVQKKFGLLAVVAVSLCAGLVFSRLVLALGGGLSLALLLCAGTLAGGLASVKIMLRLHDMCGRNGRRELLRLCTDADNCVRARDMCAHDQIKKAVEIRARMLQLAKMRHFSQLVSRLQSMITVELVAPSSEVFIEDDLPEQTEDIHGSEIIKNQYDRFIRKTLFRIGFEDMEEETVNVPVSFPRECESARTAWSELCATRDPRSTANFPARYFVPFLRRTLKNFRNKYRPEVWRSLTEASIDDLLAKFRQSAMDQEDMYEFARRIREFIVDDTCYSAHIDSEHRVGIDVGAEFYYAPIFDNGRWSEIKDLWGGIGVRDQPSRILLGRTPHFALLFAQSQVEFKVDNKRLVVRVASERKEEEEENV
jgi:hypothetical protein